MLKHRTFLPLQQHGKAGTNHKYARIFANLLRSNRPLLQLPSVLEEGGGGPYALCSIHKSVTPGGLSCVVVSDWPEMHGNQTAIRVHAVIGGIQYDNRETQR